MSLAARDTLNEALFDIIQLLGTFTLLCDRVNISLLSVFSASIMRPANHSFVKLVSDNGGIPDYTRASPAVFLLTNVSPIRQSYSRRTYNCFQHQIWQYFRQDWSSACRRPDHLNQWEECTRSLCD